MSEGSLKPAAEAPPAGAPAAPRSRAKPVANGYPESVTRLIDELAKLPGIGRRSAERLSFHILKSTTLDATALAKAITDAKSRVRHCRVCYNLMDSTTASTGIVGKDHLCPICGAAAISANPAVGGSVAAGAPPSTIARDASSVMVVEQPKDLIALEQTGLFRGVYHILMGRISPLEGVSAGDLTIRDLLERVENPASNLGVPMREVVLALNPTMEGDGTALYLAQELEKRKIKVTRLARGLPVGAPLEFASKAVLADAIQGRKPM